MRDSQRSRVYAADHSLDSFGRLETVPEIERFVSKLWKSERFKKAFSVASSWHCGQPKVKDGRRRRRARGNYYEISMPRWSRTIGVVVHELAHTVHMREYGSHCRGAAHGWEYCSVYLRLVLYSMGREAHDTLKAAFKKHGVKYRAPKKRAPLSEERRAQLTEQLAAARAAKMQKLIASDPYKYN